MFCYKIGRTGRHRPHWEALFWPFYPGQTLFFCIFFTAEVVSTTPTQTRRTLCAGPPEAAGAAGGRGRGAGGPSFRCAAVVVTRRSSRSGPMMAMLALADDRGGRGRRQLLPTCRGRMGGTEAAHMVADARPHDGGARCTMHVRCMGVVRVPESRAGAGSARPCCLPSGRDERR